MIQCSYKEPQCLHHPFLFVKNSIVYRKLWCSHETNSNSIKKVRRGEWKSYQKPLHVHPFPFCSPHPCYFFYLSIKGTWYTWSPKTVIFCVLFHIFINSRCIKNPNDTNFSHVWTLGQKSIIQIFYMLYINKFHLHLAPCISGILNYSAALPQPWWSWTWPCTIEP